MEEFQVENGIFFVFFKCRQKENTLNWSIII